MSLDFLKDYIVLVIVGICLCVGYVIKTSLDFIPNKYIPLIVLVLGTVINVGMNQKISVQIILAGMVSGLSSTGLYEAFRNFIGTDKSSAKRKPSNKKR